MTINLSDWTGATILRNAIWFEKGVLRALEHSHSDPETYRGLKQAIALMQAVDDGAFDGKGFKEIE